MKWYTLEEKRPTKDDSGLFAMKSGHFVNLFCMKEKGKLRLYASEYFIGHDGYTLDDFWYWIPQDELIATLPKQKHIDFFKTKKQKDADQWEAEQKENPECEDECGTCEICLEKNKMREKIKELTLAMKQAELDVEINR